LRARSEREAFGGHMFRAARAGPRPPFTFSADFPSGEGQRRTHGDNGGRRTRASDTESALGPKKAPRTIRFLGRVFS